MLMKILLLPILGPLDGIVWIGEKIQERTNTEFDAQENLHKQLLNLQISFDLGTISEAEFEIQEEEILLRIQELEAEAQEELYSEAESDLADQPQFPGELDKEQHLVLSP